MTQVPVLGSILPRSFYARPTKILARALLGKVLARSLEGQTLAGRIVEVEAYLGLTDPASHAFRGKTVANEVLFGPPGFTHVYLIYGLHYCLNISGHAEVEAGGVLLRAVDPMVGIETMARLRGLNGRPGAKALTGGPGKLCQALGIVRRQHNNLDVTDPLSPIQILDDGYHQQKIQTTTRIGISKATDQLLRFVTCE